MRLGLKTPIKTERWFPRRFLCSERCSSLLAPQRSPLRLSTARYVLSCSRASIRVLTCGSVVAKAGLVPRHARPDGRARSRTSTTPSASQVVPEAQPRRLLLGALAVAPLLRQPRPQAALSPSSPVSLSFVRSYVFGFLCNARMPDVSLSHMSIGGPKLPPVPPF